MGKRRNWQLCGMIPGRDRTAGAGRTAAIVCASQGSLDILPLRYAVLPTGAAKGLASLPSTLGDGVADIQLERSAYAPRFLGAGYLYVLLSRQGRKHWAAYAASAKGYLLPFDPAFPGTALSGADADGAPVRFRPPASDSGTIDVQASLITIRNAALTDKVYFLFAPLPVLQEKLDEYSANADSLVSAGKMQVFRPKDWINGSQTQPHTLTAKDLSKHVPEYLVRENGTQAQRAVAIALASAGLPTFEDTFESNRLVALKGQMEENEGAVFVLRDPIGITQELNDYRNAPMAAFEQYLDMPDGDGVTGRHRLQIHEGLVDARSAYLKGVMHEREAGVDAYYDYAEKRRQRRADFAAMSPSWMAPASEGIAEEEGRLEAAHEQSIAREQSNCEENWRVKYESRLDSEEMRRFKAAIDQQLEGVEKLANERAPDHLKWFESRHLIDAFDVFGQSNVECYNFAYCSAACSVGVTATSAGEEKASKWATATSVERANLYMRGFLFNRKDLVQGFRDARAAVAEAVTGVEHASALPPALVLKASKGLVSGFAAMDSAFDEWVRFLRDENAPAGRLARAAAWGKGVEASLLFHKVSEITRTIFRSGVGGTLDKAVAGCLGVVLHSRLGAITYKLSYDQAFMPLPEAALAECKTKNARRNALRAHAESKGSKAARLARQDARKAEESLLQLIEDARAKTQARVKASMAELNEPSKPAAINNYHQVRIGLVLGCIEAVALAEKLVHFDGSGKAFMDVFGSVFSLLGTACNMVYNGVKSVREIAPYAGIRSIKDAGDIVRGGWKLAAGALGMAASLISVVLDLRKAWETGTRDTILALIYACRAVAGGLTAMFSAVAAASYALPWLTWRGAEGRLLRLGKYAADKFVFSRWTLLVWAARFNWIGWALTLAEIGYMWFRDDELEKWMDKCVFHRKKIGVGHERSTVFRTWEDELAAMEKALFAAVAEG